MNRLNDYGNFYGFYIDYKEFTALFPYFLWFLHNLTRALALFLLRLKSKCFRSIQALKRVVQAILTRRPKLKKDYFYYNHNNIGDNYA
jgi:hypothetical protein